MNWVIRSEAQARVFPVLDVKDYCCIVYHTAPKCGVWSEHPTKMEQEFHGETSKP